MKKTRKIISLVLSILMIITSVPLMAVNSFAADVVNSGTTGDCTWTLDSDGVLTISGNGQMYNYDSNYSSPWGTLIKKAIIENGVTSIGDDAFRGCTSLTSVTIGNGVTSIGNWAFRGCTSLTSVTIPESVTIIGDEAFSRCSSLTSITIPDSVTSIGLGAFSGCTSLKNVIIGNGVTKIGWSAFGGCSSLISVTIPDSVTEIGDFAFSGCTSLTEISVSSENADYSSENGVLFNKEKTELIRYPEGKTESEYIIPDSVTSIGLSAFSDCTSLTSVTIPDSVTSIGFGAFGNCTSLTSITIPDSVTSIGNYAFEDCTWLTSVTIGNGVKSIGYSAFYNCTSLTSVTIPNSVTEIGDKAFGYYHDGYEEKIHGFTIYGNKGSEAERYANENGFKFLPMASTNELLLISVTKMPTKTEYYVGDTLDTTGLEITAKYTDNTTMVIKDGFVISGFDSSVAGKNTITVVYDGKTTTFDVEIKAPEISLPKSNVRLNAIGETAILTATAVPNNSEIVWKSSNESVATVENGVVTAKGAGNATITATITVNGIEYSAECAVTVIVAQTIEIEKLPEKTSYYIGDVINTAGLKLKITYSDGSTKIVDNGFVISGFDSMTAGQKTVTVAYDGQLTTFDIEVKTPEISLSNSNVRFNAIGETATLTATTVPSDSEIVWKSSNESVATVENGVVTAKGAGIATITATITVNGIEYSAECAVTVVLLDSIAVTKLPTKTVYFIGGTLDTTGLEITAKYTDNTEKVITSDLSITGFDSSVAGKNTITVAYDGKTATFDVEIKAPSIALSESSLAFDRAGATKTLTATAVPSDSKIVWKSSNESVATVENGVVTAKGAGTATITATITVNEIEYSAECAVSVVLLDSIAVTKMPTKTEYYVGGTLDTTGLEITAKYTDNTTKVIKDGFVISGFASSVAGKNTITIAYDGKTTTFDVEIKAPSIALSESSLAFDRAGATKTLTATAVPNNSEIVWKSSNESVATVENGIVTAKGAGTATITATITVNGIEYSAECAVSVVLLDSIAVTKMPIKTEYFIGDTLDTTGLEITAKYTNNTEKVITSDLSITSFDSSVAGKNTITVAYDGKTATFDVEIKAPSIALSESSLAFDRAGATKTLTATAVPNNSEIVWKSSNESVATVENGIVTAKGAGTATITATITVNGIEYSAECAVDVNLPTMSFPDVRSGDWYYDAVKFNFERGYITGYSNGTFGPANNIQRQDFALILARIAGADLSAYEGQNGGFSDVQTGSYYASAVAWAKDTGVANGFSADNFGVGTFISREQICIMLCRYLNGSVFGNADTILNAYPDGGNTSPWAKESVAWAVENGIIGNSYYLNPTGNAGRAEVAQIIYNMSNNGML